MTAAWLTIVGVPAEGVEGLSARARATIDRAPTVFGAARLLELLAITGDRAVPWPSPFARGIDMLLARRGMPTLVVATGDPMHFGIGATLARHIAAGEMRVVAAPSAFSLAAARLGWAVQETTCLSLHGRSVEAIAVALAPGARVLALTSDGEGVRATCRVLAARGLGAARVVVLERMGHAQERLVETTAEAACGQAFDDFNTLAIDLAGCPRGACLPRVPGLPDEAFVHDGQLTKREVRAATLAALGPFAGGRLWDIGAGAGSVAIEWMRAAPGAMAIAFERDLQRIEWVRTNAVQLGTPDLTIVAGEVPATLAGQPRPDAIFLGGAVADEDVFDAAWLALADDGVLVANAVTLEGEVALIARQARLGGELVRIDIAHLTRVGAFRAMRPRMPVLQWRVVKAAGVPDGAAS